MIVTVNITDTNGQPLPGANVSYTDYSYMKSTDSLGNAQVEVYGQQMVEISFIGYESVMTTLNENESVVNITLEESSSLLSEAIVIGDVFKINYKPFVAMAIGLLLAIFVFKLD